MLVLRLYGGVSMSASWLLLSLSLPWIFSLGVIVAQATSPNGGPITSKPLSWFKVKSNSRKNFDEASLRALGKDLRVRQISPLVCLPDGTIVSGERRYRAAILEGLTELNVIIITDPITEAEFNRLQLVENLQRQDLSNAEKCAGCVKFARSNQGMNYKQIAEELHVDASMVTRWMAWERVIEPVQQALAANAITLQAMYAISQCAQAEQAAALASALAAPNAAAATRAVRRKTNGSSTVRTARVKCQMPSGVLVTLAGEGDGLTLDDVEETLVALLKEVRKGKEQGLDSKTFSAVMRDKSKAS
jgi:ParB/RepB/Spo0J family partition protein